MEAINLQVGHRIDFAGYTGTIIKDHNCPFSDLHMEAEMDDGRTLTFTRDGRYLNEQKTPVVTVIGSIKPTKKYWLWAYYMNGEWMITPMHMDDDFNDEEGVHWQMIKERPHQKIEASMEEL